MPRNRPSLDTGFGVEGPWLAEIANVLSDLHDLLDARLPQPQDDTGKGPVRISEPAPDRPPAQAEPVAEPAPDEPAEEDPERVTEPAPNLPDRPLPDPPRRHGRGSGVEAWQAFADAAGVTYPADASRADIIAACEHAGVITAA